MSRVRSPMRGGWSPGAAGVLPVSAAPEAMRLQVTVEEQQLYEALQVEPHDHGAWVEAARRVVRLMRASTRGSAIPPSGVGTSLEWTSPASRRDEPLFAYFAVPSPF